MALWNFAPESRNVASGANTAQAWRVGGQPSYQGSLTQLYQGPQAGKRNVILTDKGWVYRKYVTGRANSESAKKIEEVLVAANPGLGTGSSVSYASNAYAFKPEVSQIYFSANSTGGTALVRSAFANVYVVFNEPVYVTATALTLTLANTASGNAMTCRHIRNRSTNPAINANNTLVFTFKPGVAGSYKLPAQSIANTSAGGIITWNAGNETANLVITGTVSNTVNGSFSGGVKVTVRSATTGG